MTTHTTSTTAQTAGSYEPGGLFTDTPWAFEEQHIAWRETMHQFVSDRVQTGAAERSVNGTFDAELVAAVGDLGVFGLLVEEPVGGGADLRSLSIAIEEIARVDSSLAVTAHVQACNVALFDALTVDRPELREAILPDAVAGKTFISFGLTEPRGGSDAGGVTSRATRDGAGWVLNGSKQFITNSGTPFSKYVIAFASTGTRPNGRPEVSAFLVPLDAAGVEVGAAYHKLGWRSSDTHPIFFEDVLLDESALIGTEGRGAQEAMRLLVWARIPIAAMGLGLARGAIDGTLDFVRSRESFGRPLASYQSVGFSLADMAAEAATARLHTYDAAWKYDHGLAFDREAAIAKLLVGDIANKVAYEATELHGGYGFMAETDAVRHYQDARILTIGEGTSAIQRLLLARHLGVSDS